MLRQSKLAEALGYDVLWAHEHHAGAAMYPSPLMTLAVLAARTQRINLGTNMLLLPLHHPLRVAENGAMVWQQHKGGTPYWNTELGDFMARVEFKLPPGGNNGLAIRYPGKGNTAYDGMCELQVLDDNYEKVRGKIDPRQAHGSAYGMVAAARGYQHPIGEWNFEEVTVKGSTLKVELNGSVILDCDLSKVDMENVMAKSKHPGATRTSGFFGFAGHSDPVEFRNIFIKKL